MRINTAVMGEVDIPPEQIFHLPEGLYGFEGVTDYTLLQKQEDDVTLMWLQSTTATVPCFVVFDPYALVDGFSPQLEPHDLAFLGAKEESELSFYVIAVVPEEITDITVNLKSPVVVNRRDHRGRQVILANQDYPIRFPLFEQES